MNINLYENTIGYTAGDSIAGTIDITIIDPFEAKELVLSLVGVERSFLDASQVLEPLDYNREVKTIINLREVITTYTSAQ